MPSNFLTAFLPCRAGSQRVQRKNIRPFGPYKYGLVQLKLNQLLQCQEIDSLFFQLMIMKLLSTLSLFLLQRLLIHRRSDSLSSHITSTDDLILHCLDLYLIRSYYLDPRDVTFLQCIYLPTTYFYVIFRHLVAITTP